MTNDQAEMQHPLKCCKADLEGGFFSFFFALSLIVSKQVEAIHSHVTLAVSHILYDPEAEPTDWRFI